jgi:hypothetical protein
VVAAESTAALHMTSMYSHARRIQCTLINVAVINGSSVSCEPSMSCPDPSSSGGIPASEGSTQC